MTSLTSLLSSLPEGGPGADARALVRRAYQYAQEAGVDDATLERSLSVASILADLHLDAEVMAATLLQRTGQPDSIRELFGESVAGLVRCLARLDEVEGRVRQDEERARDTQELESLRKFFIAMAEDDIRVIFIKLAERIHQMREAQQAPAEVQQRLARGTLEIYAPLANRLGIWQWKAELEDLSFRYLNPATYHEMERLLASRRDERQARVQRHIRLLQEALRKAGIPHKIKGRPKHIYSIYSKMRRKSISLAQVYDAEGIRVIVETEPQCYQVLGIVHQLWTPIPAEFDDYIANPKPNGYQSLHTAVIGEDGRALEVQIRTEEMDYVAEFGVAAHWRYKEQEAKVSPQLMEHIAALRRGVRDLTEAARDARTFIKELRKADFFENRIFVFTPKGKVIELPPRATPIDFAYAIHTEVGHRCRGARVNGRWVPLDHPLQTGDQVEIVTGKSGGPSRDWLNAELGFVKTNRARQKIRQWFRRQTREENVARGRAIVEQELKRLGLENDFTVEEIAEMFAKRYPRVDEFLYAVGVGDVGTERLVHRIELRQQREQPQEEEELPEETLIAPPAVSRPPQTGDLHVQGTGGLLTRLAQCCHPLPGDEIVGYVTRGRGVTIHRRDCPNILRLGRLERERLIEVSWGTSQATFAVQVLIQAYDRTRLLHDITAVLANEEVNLTAVKTGKRNRYNILPIYITIEVPSLTKLDRVLSKLGQIPNIVEVRRNV